MDLNPNSKGWIRKYFSLIENKEKYLKDLPEAFLNAEELIYAYLQPTGFLYGYPSKPVFLKEDYFFQLTEEEAFKVLLLEGLVLVEHVKERAYNHNQIEQSLNRFVDFYESTNLNKAKKSWLDFSKLDVYGKLESIINQRIEVKKGFTSKLLTTYFYNGLLFHDLILYQDFLNQKDKLYITKKRAQITLDLIKIIAIAAHADGIVNSEEKSVFKMFLSSANLDKTKTKIAENFINQKHSISELKFNHFYYDTQGGWLLKRHILEIAILTFWSDQGISEDEKQFLDELTLKLNLSEEDKDNAFIAIQSFVLTNQRNAQFLTGKKDIEIVLKGISKRWVKILSRHKSKLAQELKQSKELVILIKKSTTQELTDIEKEKVKTQFYDIAKTIPSLALFMLPGGAIILPIVLKIIPNLVPSAFQDNVIEEE